MLNTNFYKKFFLIAATWNIVGGLVALIGYRSILQQFFYCEASTADNLLLVYHFVLFSFVVIMGLALIMVARDPSSNRALIFASALGKIVPPAIWSWMFFTGHGSWLLFTGSLGDLFFSAFFILYLLRTPKH